MLEVIGHSTVAVDLPGDSEDAGLPEYAALTIAAARGHDEVVLVAQSLGGFTVPLVAAHLVDEGRPPPANILVNAKIPAPRDNPGPWWEDQRQ
jgi:hypothetical protein